MRDTSGISTRLGRAIWTLFEGSRKTKGPFLVATVILGFLSIFKKSQATSPFEALNSAGLSRCQRDVRPLVQMRRRSRAFSRVSTGDSDIHSSCEMKDEPAFKPLQGNPAFFRVRASQCSFKPLVLYDVECGMALEPLQRNWASFPLDLVYTGLFRIYAVTSVSF